MYTSLPDFALGEVLLIDKPLDWTSFDAVRKIRNTIRIKKVGHAGTLDPLATGLLILCTGKKTKSIEQYQAQEKEYTGSLVLGKTTPSYDLGSAFDASYPTEHITPEMIYEASRQLTGTIEQIPPAFSAIKKNGQRLYELARKGKAVQADPRIVTIHTFEITAINLPEVSFRVVCSKGTYIRSLVVDLGKAVQSGATMTSLRRTRIGDYHVDDAWQIATFVDHIKALQT